MSVESSISITRHHLVGMKVLLPGFFLSLAQGAALLSLYLLADPVQVGSGAELTVAFVALLLAFWGCGAWFWGRAVDGESSLAPPLLALSQGLAGLFWLFWPWLLSFSGFLGAAIYPWAESGTPLTRLLGQALALAPLLALPAFFCGGTLPLLTEMGLKKRRRLEWNLPLISAFRLAGLAAGFAAAIFAPWSPGRVLWAALGLNILAALLIPLMGDKPEQDEYSGAAEGRRLWPSRSLGLWSGEAINVLDHDLSKSAARPAWLVTFLCSLAIFCALALGGVVGLWMANFDALAGGVAYNSQLWLLYIPAAMALGSLLIAPQLSRLGSPSTVLAMAAALTVFGLLLAPWLWGRMALVQYTFLAYLWPCAVWGTLLPLAGQVFQARRHWLASSLGLAAFWLCLGAAAGLILGGSTLSDLLSLHQAAALYTLAALLAAFLALAPRIGHVAAIILWIAATLLLLIFIQPNSFKAGYSLDLRAPSLEQESGQ